MLWKPFYSEGIAFIFWLAIVLQNDLRMVFRLSALQPGFEFGLMN